MTTTVTGQRPAWWGSRLMIETACGERFCVSKRERDQYQPGVRLACDERGRWKPDNDGQTAPGADVSPLIEPWNVLDYADYFEWMVTGGESGPGSRPCDVRGLVRMGAQARHAGIAVHNKQLGANPLDGDKPIKLRHSHGGNMDEWPEWVPRWRDPAPMPVDDTGSFAQVEG